MANDHNGCNAYMSTIGTILNANISNFFHLSIYLLIPHQTA